MTPVTAADRKLEIHDIVDFATSDELSPIVKILVATPFSYLLHYRAYQDHRPDHVAYREQIADEICRLAMFVTAGSMALAGTMVGPRPGYSEVLTSVCKHIGIPIANQSWRNLEKIFVNMFVERHLLTVEPEHRGPLAVAAASAAGGAANGVFCSDAWPPVAAALLHIATLRETFDRTGRFLSMPRTKPETDPAPSQDNAESRILVVGDDAEPVLSLDAIRPEDSAGWTFIKPDSRTLNKLTPLTEALQPVFSAQQMLSGSHVYRAAMPLSYSSKLGGFAGVAKGHQGMVPLQQFSAIGLSGPAIFLTAATAIVQQQQMERIEATLDEIKTVIADVSRFQQDERRSQLTGTVRYFRQVAEAVLAGELAPEVLHAIEHHEGELSKIHDHLVGDIKRNTATLASLDKSSLGSTKYLKALQETQAAISSHYDDLFLCLRARACGLQLLHAYPGREFAKKSRHRDICEAMRPYLPTGTATVAIDQALRRKIKSLSDYQNKAPILLGEGLMLDRIMAAEASIMSGIAAAVSKEEVALEAPVIDLRISEGQITGVRLGRAGACSDVAADAVRQAAC